MFRIHSGCLTTILLHKMQTAMQSRSPAFCTSSSLPLSFSMGLWKCQYVSTKQILFPLLLPKVHLASGFVQKTRQPLLRSLKNLSFSHTPCQVRKGGGTGLLISNKYSTYSPLCNNHSLESHAITVTAPVKTPCCSHLSPSWAIGTFLQELNGPVVLITLGWQSTCSLW